MFSNRHTSSFHRAALSVVLTISASTLVSSHASAAPLVGTKIRSWSGVTTFGEFGRAVGAAGDVDGDGYADVVVGAPETSIVSPTGGYIDMYSGRTGALLYTIPSPIPYITFGGAVAGVGDIDGDGRADFVAGCSSESDPLNPNSQPGSVRLYSGATGALLMKFYGPSHQALYGAAVSSAGDANNDGYPDILVGMPNATVVLPVDGAVETLSGEWIRQTLLGLTPASPKVLMTRHGSSAYGSFGSALDVVGKIDGDLCDDVVVSEPGFNVSSGKAYLISGRTGARIRTVFGVQGYDVFGASVAGLGDVDQDGMEDFAVGAPHYLFGGPAYVRVFSGRTGAILHHIPQFQLYDYFGFSVSGVGDVDQDGSADIVIGAMGSSSVYVHSGATGLHISKDTGTPGDEFGWSVKGVGDIDGNGVPDWAVGARQYNSGPGICVAFEYP
jgi:hypothetical protein